MWFQVSEPREGQRTGWILGACTLIGLGLLWFSEGSKTCLIPNANIFSPQKCSLFPLSHHFSLENIPFIFHLKASLFRRVS